MKIIHILFSLGLILSTASCSQQSIQLDPILNNNQCGITHKTLLYIDSDKQLNQMFKATFNNPIKNLNKIDFSTSAIILISMGQQPSAGYSIQLNTKTANIKNNTLNIDASFKKPSLGNYQAQVITSPCVLYKVNKQNIRTVKLLH